MSHFAKPRSDESEPTDAAVPASVQALVVRALRELAEVPNFLLLPGECHRVSFNGLQCVIFRSGLDGASLPSLSERERQIVSLVGQGEPTKVIATRLRIRPSTVESYIRRVFGKLGVTSRPAMIARATELEVFHGPAGARTDGAPQQAAPGGTRPRRR